jgi:hypothetical protein
MYCRDGPRARLAKQREVRNFLEVHLPDYPIDAYDRVLGSARECGDRERPDFYWNRGAWSVILEVDEEQHKGRPEECECIRMINLFQSEGGIPVFFIRFNPDAYQSRELSLSLKQRLSVLRDWLKASLEQIPSVEAAPMMLRLFFDDHLRATTHWEALDYQPHATPSSAVSSKQSHLSV